MKSATDKKIIIGKFGATHGVRGDIKVYPLTDFPERFADIKSGYVDDKPIEILHTRYQKNFVVMKIKGVDSREDAMRFTNKLLKIDRDDLENARTQNLLRGEYDIWLLIMANEQITTTTSGNQDLSDMYNYLAYQSYYNSMYGGGYYGYGYGGYGSYYSNYYNYSMMAAYAASSSTSTSNVVMLDKDRFYKAMLNGPESTTGRVPVLELTFAVPNGE